jgi:hypothetical protein
MIASVLSWFCVTKFTGDKVKNIPQSIKSVLQLIMHQLLPWSLEESLKVGSKEHDRTFIYEMFGSSSMSGDPTRGGLASLSLLPVWIFVAMASNRGSSNDWFSICCVVVQVKAVQDGHRGKGYVGGGS